MDPEEQKNEQQQVTTNNNGGGDTISQTDMANSSDTRIALREVPAFNPDDYQEELKGYDLVDAQLQAEQARLAETEETPEQRAKRERREKSQRIVSALGDGLRAMGNLYFTTKYAPNMYNHEKDSQYNATTTWQDKMKKERDDNHAAYIDYAMKIGANKSAKAKTLRELEAQYYNNAYKKALAEGRAFDVDNKIKTQPYVIRQQEAKAVKGEADANRAQTQADNQGAIDQSTINKNNAAANKSNHDANKPQGGSKGSGGGKKKKKGKQSPTSTHQSPTGGGGGGSRQSPTA